MSPGIGRKIEKIPNSSADGGKSFWSFPLPVVHHHHFDDYMNKVCILLSIFFKKSANHWRGFCSNPFSYKWISTRHNNTSDECRGFVMFESIRSETHVVPLFTRLSMIINSPEVHSCLAPTFTMKTLVLRVTVNSGFSRIITYTGTHISKK